MSGVGSPANFEEHTKNNPKRKLWKQAKEKNKERE